MALARKRLGNMTHDEVIEYYYYLWEFLHERGLLPERHGMPTPEREKKFWQLFESIMKKLEAGGPVDDLTDEEYAVFTMRAIRFTS
jgi:hypothetical protein